MNATTVGRIADGLMRALVVITLLASGYVAYLQHHQSACLTAYAEKAALAAVQARQAAAEDRTALDQMVNSIVGAHASGDVSRALTNYQATRAAADDRRARNPAPAPPSQFCD